MPEAGGPTTQAGITYQDSVAALYLGRLCDMQSRPPNENILEVRIEAPENVDDIVVTYTDRHKEYMQVKENVNKHDDAWKKMWGDMALQRNQVSFNESDNLVLIFGNYNKDYSDLQEIALRASGSQSEAEWLGRLTNNHNKLLDNIKATHSLYTNNIDTLFHIFQCLRVEIIPYYHIERDFVPYWIPSSNQPKASLFNILRSLAGHHARNRRAFTTVQLLSELEEQYHFLVNDPQVFGTKVYMDCVRAVYSRIGIPCTPFYGPIEQLFVWPKIQKFDSKHATLLGNIEDPYHFTVASNEVVQINDFPNIHLHRAVVVASAGFGKTTLSHALIHKLAGTHFIPVFIGLLDFASSNQTVAEYLSSTINRQYSVHIPWDEYCVKGRVVVFFDGLDELSPNDAKSVLTSISIFSNRFPQSSWLLTVRDSRAVSISLPADILALQPLDHNDIIQFCEAYGTLHGAINVPDFLTRITSHNDLRALATIPLFLSLMISTYHQHELPKNRAELLEHYISIIFHPEEYKNAVELTHDPITIRRMAELLSYNALEKKKIGFSERELDSILRSIPTINPSRLVNELCLCGILQKNAFTFNFFFPIVQEYLASCYVTDNLSIHDIISKFQLLSSRPWAQALQFALEKHPDAQTIISALLLTEDDAFDSLKVLLGRCVANGSFVTPRLKQELGEVLTKVWFTHPLEHCRIIGLILRDGFTEPMPPLLKNLLQQGKGLSFIGGKEILEACQDTVIALEAIRSIFDGPIDGWYRISDVNEAIPTISNQILDMYITYCENGPCDVSPIYSLNKNDLKPDKYKLIAENPKIPLHIRLAAYRNIGPLPLPDEALGLINMVLHSNMPEEDKPGKYAIYTSISLILNTANPQKSCVHYYDIVPKKIKLKILTSVRDCEGLLIDQRLALLREMENRCDDSELISANRLCQAYLSLPDDTILKTTALNSLSMDHLLTWFYIASRIKSTEPLATGVSHLYTMTLSSDMKKMLSSGLARATRNDIYLRDYLAGQYKPCSRHPADSEMQALLKHWEKEAKEQNDEVHLYLSTLLSDLGDKDSIDKLVKYLNSHLLNLAKQTTEDRYLNNAVSHYLGTLEKNHVLLDLDLLDSFIRRSSGNAARVALIMLLKHGNKSALHKVLGILNQIGDDKQSYLTNQVRILSSKLGIKIIKQENRYVAID